MPITVAYTYDTLGNVVLALTESAVDTFGANGALSLSSVSFTGAPITGGTATTNVPLILISPAGQAVSTSWNTNGTFLGFNSTSGWTGNFIDCQKNGVSQFRVSQTGCLVVGSGGLTVTNGANLGVLCQATLFRLTALLTPATAAATGTLGDMKYDTGFIYICTATDTWKRVAIATW